MRWLLLLLLTSCSAMQQHFVDQLCNTGGAFDQGYNDGHGHGRMDSSFANECPADQDALRRAYHDGFSKGAAQKTTEELASQDHQNGVPAPGWECRDSFGKRYCGYDCRDAYGKILCARTPGYNCVAAFGTIKCGYKCREEFGEIQCDKYE